MAVARQRRAAAMMVLGREREGEAVERRGLGRVSESGGRVATLQGVTEQAGRQEVAGRVAVAGCGAGTHLLGEGEKTTEEEAGWAGLAS